MAPTSNSMRSTITRTRRTPLAESMADCSAKALWPPRNGAAMASTRTSAVPNEDRNDVHHCFVRPNRLRIARTSRLLEMTASAFTAAATLDPRKLRLRNLRACEQLS